MLRVETYVAPSPIHGLGLFAKKDIAAGTVIWRFTPVFDVTFSEVDLANLPKLNREEMEKHAYYCKRKQLYILGGDDIIYVNHSETPNVADRNDDYLAIKNISAGDELTENYSSYGEKLNEDHNSYFKSPYHPIKTWKKFLRIIGIDP